MFGLIDAREELTVIEVLVFTVLLAVIMSYFIFGSQANKSGSRQVPKYLASLLPIGGRFDYKIVNEIDLPKEALRDLDRSTAAKAIRFYANNEVVEVEAGSGSQILESGLKSIMKNIYNKIDQAKINIIRVALIQMLSVDCIVSLLLESLPSPALPNLQQPFYAITFDETNGLRLNICGFVGEPLLKSKSNKIITYTPVGLICRSSDLLTCDVDPDKSEQIVTYEFTIDFTKDDAETSSSLFKLS